MVHRYIADTLATLSQPTVGRYLERRVTDDRPMRRPYIDRYSAATRSLYRLIYRPTVDRYIGVDTPYNVPFKSKLQHPPRAFDCFNLPRGGEIDPHA